MPVSGTGCSSPLSSSAIRPLRILQFLGRHLLGIVADGNHVDLLFLGIDRIQSRGQRVVLDAGGFAEGRIIGQVSHDADVARVDVDPSRVLDLAVSDVLLFGLHDLVVVAVAIDAITAGAEGPPQDALALGLAQIAVHQELAAGQIVAQLAGDDRQFAGLHDDVGNEVSLPPNRAIEVPPGTGHLLFHADFALFGEVAGLGIFAAPDEDQRTFVAQQQTLPFRHVNAIHRPLETLVEQRRRRTTPTRSKKRDSV